MKIMQPSQKIVNESAEELNSLLLQDSTEEGSDSACRLIIKLAPGIYSSYSSGSHEETLSPDDYEITEKFEMVL